MVHAAARPKDLGDTRANKFDPCWAAEVQLDGEGERCYQRHWWNESWKASVIIFPKFLD